MDRFCFLKSAKAAPIFAALAVATVRSPFATAQSDARARQIISAAVASELAANKNDHSAWTYKDHDTDATKNVVYEVVETPAGSVKREVISNGKPVDAATQSSETARIAAFVHDPDALARQRKADQHDDEQARQMLGMLPDAYIWTLKSEDAEQASLSYRPNPAFRPPNMEARVMGTMAGEVIVVKAGNRIRTLRGTLTDDVKIGFGLLGKLQKGGTFDIERREVAPHSWQITESRVHIGGHALLFKTIGQQEDEIMSDFKPSTAPNLEAAAQQLGVAH